MDPLTGKPHGFHPSWTATLEEHGTAHQEFSIEQLDAYLTHLATDSLPNMPAVDPDLLSTVTTLMDDEITLPPGDGSDQIEALLILFEHSTLIAGKLLRGLLSPADAAPLAMRRAYLQFTVLPAYPQTDTRTDPIHILARATAALDIMKAGRLPLDHTAAKSAYDALFTMETYDYPIHPALIGAAADIAVADEAYSTAVEFQSWFILTMDELHLPPPVAHSAAVRAFALAGLAHHAPHVLEHIHGEDPARRLAYYAAARARLLPDTENPTFDTRDFDRLYSEAMELAQTPERLTITAPSQSPVSGPAAPRRHSGGRSRNPRHRWRP